MGFENIEGRGMGSLGYESWTKSEWDETVTR